MSISLIEESEIPEQFMVSTIIYLRSPSDSTGQVVLVNPGHHPKCRIARVTSTYITYSTAGDVAAIEDGDGNDAATITMTSTPAVGKAVAGALILGQIFERNEAIAYNLTTAGNAANSTITAIQIESIH